MTGTRTDGDHDDAESQSALIVHNFSLRMHPVLGSHQQHALHICSFGEITCLFARILIATLSIGRSPD